MCKTILASAAAGVCLLGLNGCSRVVREHDLLREKCALVERMEAITFMASEETFSIGVLCPMQRGDRYTELFSAGQPSHYGVAIDPNDNGKIQARVFYCPARYDTSKDEVVDRLRKMNERSSELGFALVLDNSDACSRSLSHIPGLITDELSKTLDRKVQ